MEYEADMYGINASQQPDGKKRKWTLCWGSIAKLDPGPVEEFYLFDHPSGADADHGGDAVEGGAFAGARRSGPSARP